ncbi:MAG: hypothetical protein L0Z46_09485 [Nitrospiraceae bacterium]|nr:hypothetical protein [Nitrospiraceae bacterium]
MRVRMLLCAAAAAMVWSLAVGCPAPQPPRPIRDGVATTGPGTTPTGTIAATTSLECGNKVYEVSTGTSKGNCTITVVDGKSHGANCDDEGNKSDVSCAKGCGATSGSGSCTVKSSN